jgi:hypothetical protein
MILIKVKADFNLHECNVIWKENKKLYVKSIEHWQKGIIINGLF